MSTPVSSRPACPFRRPHTGGTIAPFVAPISSTSALPSGASPSTPASSGSSPSSTFTAGRFATFEDYLLPRSAPSIPPSFASSGYFPSGSSPSPSSPSLPSPSPPFPSSATTESSDRFTPNPTGLLGAEVAKQDAKAASSTNGQEAAVGPTLRRSGRARRVVDKNIPETQPASSQEGQKRPTTSLPAQEERATKRARGAPAVVQEPMTFQEREAKWAAAAEKDGRIHGPCFLERAPKSAKAIRERYVKQRKVKLPTGGTEWTPMNVRSAGFYTETRPQKMEMANDDPSLDDADLELCEFTRVHNGYRYSRFGNHYEDYRNFFGRMQTLMEGDTEIQSDAWNAKPRAVEEVNGHSPELPPEDIRG